jgi:hypothetical protein
MGNCVASGFSEYDIGAVIIEKSVIEETVRSVKMESIKIDAVEIDSVLLSGENDLEEKVYEETDLEKERSSTYISTYMQSGENDLEEKVYEETDLEKERSSTYISTYMGDDDDDEKKMEDDSSNECMIATASELSALRESEDAKSMNEIHQAEGTNMLYSYQNKSTPCASNENLASLDEGVHPKVPAEILAPYHCVLIKRSVRHRKNLLSWLGRRQQRVFVLENGICSLYAQALTDEDGISEYPFGIDLKQCFDLSDYEIIVPQPISPEADCEEEMEGVVGEDAFGSNQNSVFLLHKIRPDKLVQPYTVDEDGLITGPLKTRSNQWAFCQALHDGLNASAMHALFMMGSERISFVPTTTYENLLAECVTGEDKELQSISGELNEADGKFNHVLHFLNHIEHARRVVTKSGSGEKVTIEQKWKEDDAFKQMKAGRLHGVSTMNLKGGFRVTVM